MSDLTGQDIAQHLRTARKKAPHSSVYAFHLPDGRVDLSDLTVDDEAWRIVHAPSELAIREAFAEHATSNRDPQPLLAIITPVQTRDLSTDVRVRIADTNLFAFDPWESLKTLFDASTLDWSLRGNDAQPLGRALLRVANSQGFPPTATAVLDAHTAWDAYLQRALGLSTSPTRIADLFRHEARFTSPALDQELLPSLKNHLTHKLGPATAIFFAALHSQTSALAIGLAIHTALSAANADPNLASSTAILLKALEKEKYLGAAAQQLKIDAGPAHLETFANEAAHASKHLLQHHHIQELDHLLTTELTTSAQSIALHSPVSNLGFKARRQQAAQAILTALTGDTSALQLAITAVESHHNATANPHLVQTLKNTARLASWLQDHQPDPTGDTADLATRYIHDLSFVDTLRESLTGRDPGPELQPAVDATLDRAMEISAQFNKRFATDLARQLAGAPTPSNVLVVHQVLSEVVAPLLSHNNDNVLLIVLDGLSWSVTRALMNTHSFDPWQTWAPARNATLTPMLAALPSITKHSRTALLTGKLQTGTQHTERTEFPKNPAILKALSARGKDRRKTAIFHKAELDAAGRGNIGPQVKNAIDDPQTALVAVVVNAIDDQLNASDQVSFDWNLDAVTPLRSLLTRATDRTVILVGDHGHVWETDTEKVRDVGSGAARFRSTDHPPTDGELRFEGSMIEKLTGEKAIIAPYSEKVRYTGGRRGYHGGASLQELVTPLLVLTPDDTELPTDRFTPISTAPPPWWRFETVEITIESAPHPPQEPQEPQLNLLTPSPRVQSTRRGGARRAEGPHEQPNTLITNLLTSPTLKSQLNRSTITINPDDFTQVLTLLRANNDRLSIASIANALSRNTSRTHRLLTAIARTLNRDGYPVLHIDRTENIAQLNPDLLKTQFQL